MKIPAPEKPSQGKKQNIAETLRDFGGDIASSTVKGSKEMFNFAGELLKNTDAEDMQTVAMLAVGFGVAWVLGDREADDSDGDDKSDKLSKNSEAIKTADTATTSGGTVMESTSVNDKEIKPTTSTELTKPYTQARAKLRQQVGPSPHARQSIVPGIDKSPRANKNFTSNEKVVKRLNKYREQRDGLAILDYSGDTCRQFGIPLSVFREMINVESSWKPSVKNRRSSATGLGQFLDSSWRYFMSYCKRNKIHDSKWGSKPLTLNHRYNPYCSIYATAWAMRQTKKDSTLGKLINASPPHIQGKIYYLAHHEGKAGAKKYLKFLKRMQQEGCKSRADIMASYNANPDVYNRILHPSQVRRIKRRGIKTFLSIYFTLCTRISNKVYAGTNADNPREQYVARRESRETREFAGSIDKYSTSKTAVIGDSYAGGASRVLSGVVPKKNTFYRHSTSTRHFNALLKGIKNKLLPLSRRNELIALIKRSKSIFLKLGGNEYSRGLSKFQSGMKELIALMREINPNIQIIVPEIGPSNPKSNRRSSIAKNHHKKEAINKWIRSGGGGLFKPLKWAHLVQDRSDPRFITTKYASSDKIHVNRAGFRTFASAFLDQSVVKDAKVTDYIRKYGIA